MWTNGAVDHAWLDSMFADAGLKNPVPYWKQRDYRTLKALLPHVKADELDGFVAHDALWDAKWQAAHAVKLLVALPAKPTEHQPDDTLPDQLAAHVEGQACEQAAAKALVGNDWIEWSGGTRPVARGTRIDVRHRDGDEYAGLVAGESRECSDWSHTHGVAHPGDIVAYRLSDVEVTNG
ncbi:hypothetical protein D3C85_1005660 [compost metagenome]